MLKIGILGADGGDKSGHAREICKILSNSKYDVELTGIYGDEPEETRALAASQHIPRIIEKPEELLGEADAVFVLPRDGNRHLAYAMPYIEAGVPVFVDKPFACTTEDAKKMISAAKKSGSVLCGGSYVKYTPEIREMKQVIPKSAPVSSAYFSFPLYIDNPYCGIHFYSHHLISEMLNVFGYGVKTISAMKTENKVTATAQYENFPVIMNYAANNSGLHAAVYFEDGSSLMKTVQLAGADALQCERFLEAVQTGKGDETEELLMSTVISNALQESLKTEKKVIIEECV